MDNWEHIDFTPEAKFYELIFNYKRLNYLWQHEPLDSATVIDLQTRFAKEMEYLANYISINDKEKLEKLIAEVSQNLKIYEAKKNEFSGHIPELIYEFGRKLKKNYSDEISIDIMVYALKHYYLILSDPKRSFYNHPVNKEAAYSETGALYNIKGTSFKAKFLAIDNDKPKRIRMLRKHRKNVLNELSGIDSKAYKLALEELENEMD